MNWICSQIGAREHYAIPRVLHRRGKLDSLYTDLWASPLWREAGSMIGRPALASRYHRDLETARVKNFNLTTLVDKAFGGGVDTNPYEWFLRVGSDFGRSVEASLQRRFEGWRGRLRSSATSYASGTTMILSSFTPWLISA
jgi:hypothetical protein